LGVDVAERARDEVGDDRQVDLRRLEIIDSDTGMRFHGAMRDQQLRAREFERLMRWQRMRHELMLPDDDDLGAGHPDHRLGEPVDLRGLSATAAPLAPRQAG
jgi:hypothetical protein